MFRYSNVVATIALFVVLGGSSYAAGTQLARNSVGSKQVRDRSLIARDFKRGQLKADPAGPVRGGWSYPHPDPRDAIPSIRSTGTPTAA